MIISSWNFDLQYSYGQSFNDFDSTSYLKKKHKYLISTNKRRAVDTQIRKSTAL